MSRSFDTLVDGIANALRAHILPNVANDFARGQILSSIYALNGLKLAADWKIGPLLEQIRIQDAAFAELRHSGELPEDVGVPADARVPAAVLDAEALEAVRDDGDRRLGAALDWTDTATAASHSPESVCALRDRLRAAIRDQLKAEMATIPPSMLQEIAAGLAETAPTY